ncbi:MAG: alpha/beta hydrolase [Clostridia bacterium]|nr:alpha/beta hydrolase [Clostridia bacterium]
MIAFNKKTIQLSNEEYAYLDIGQGEPIILVHGNMSSSVHYMPLIERLQGEYRCVAPDLRGFGDSSYNHEFSSMKELAEDLYEFMQAIKIERARFVCWSAGCPVTLQLASEHPEAVEAIFAIEGGSCHGYPIYKKNKEFISVYGSAYNSKAEMAADPVQVAPMLNILASKSAAAMTAVWDSVIYTVNKPEKADNEVYINETLKQRCLLDLDWALANVNMFDKQNAYSAGDNSIAKVKCPCAFTMADKDLSVPDWMVMENVNAIKGSKLIAYVDCGHSPLVDCPDALARDVKEFFSE